MPNIPQLTTPVTNNKSYSFTNRQYDGNIEPFDMVELTQPLKASSSSDGESAAAMTMGRKNLAPLTVQIKDPTMAVETLKNLLSSDILEQTMINGYDELCNDMDELIKSFYLNPEKLVREIQNQEKQNTMFSGDEFYKLLHGILKTTTSPEIRESMGTLLKALNFSTNKQEILNALSANLKFLSEYFSPNAALSKRLSVLSAGWADKNAANLFETLKGETLALLKELSGSLLNDERTQTFIPLIVHNLSRYNTNRYMLKEAFANFLAYIPSNEMRKELSASFNELLQKLFSQKQLDEMNSEPDIYNNTLNQKENQEQLSFFDNRNEKLTISLFIKTKMSDEHYVSQLNLTQEKLEFLTSSFFEGKQSGIQTLKNIFLSLLSGNDGRQMIPAVHKEFSSIKDMTGLVEYLNEVLRQMPDISQREQLFKAFTDIVNTMAQRKELPASSNVPSAPSTLDKLTDFIGKNINHEAIRSLDNFNASNLLQSLLNAPGVFTPLAHYVLPLRFEDTKAFGELWVDNDENNPNNTPAGQKNYHLFLTFDVESIGRFEVDMYALGENISLSLLYPESYGFRVKRLTEKIDLVIRNIGYKPVKFETSVLKRPHVLTEVFPKLVERRKGLNVQA